MHLDTFAMVLATLTFIVGAVVMFLITKVDPRLLFWEVREQKLREEQEKIRTSLAGKTFWVNIRTTKNGKTDMETELIGYMVGLGIKVIALKPDTTADSKDILICVGVYEIALGDFGSGHWLDLRVVMADEEIRAAHHIRGGNMGELAHNTLVYLSQVMK